MGWWYVNVSCFDGFTIVWQNFTLTSLNTAPSITTSPGLTGTPGVAYFYDADATDLNGDTLEWAATENPVWMVVDPTNGQCTGIPVVNGNYDVKLVAFDGLAYAYQNWTIVVSDVVVPPTTPPVNPTGGPTAHFSYILQGTKLAVMDSSYGTISSYSWDFGDGFGGQGKQLTHTYAGPGTYTVKLTVTDDMGYTSTAEAIITIAEGVAYGIERGQSGYVLVTPGFTIELGAIPLIIVGILMAIVSFSGKRMPFLTPRGYRVIAAVLLVIGLGYFVL
jgi:hypothetical protein